MEPARLPRRGLTMNRAELCEALGCADEKLRKVLPALEAQGFPRKLPGLNAWSRPAVTDWIAHNGGTYTPYAERGPALVTVSGTGDVAAALEARYGGRAA